MKTLAMAESKSSAICRLCVSIEIRPDHHDILQDAQIFRLARRAFPSLSKTFEAPTFRILPLLDFPLGIAWA